MGDLITILQKNRQFAVEDLQIHFFYLPLHHGKRKPGAAKSSEKLDTKSSERLKGLKEDLGEAKEAKKKIPIVDGWCHSSVGRAKD